jgi:hypothetical protein
VVSGSAKQRQHSSLGVGVFRHGKVVTECAAFGDQLAR